MAMMKALVKARPEPGLWMQQVPIPSIGPNDVLIKIQKTGICGTDLHIVNWDAWAKRNIREPWVIGHEFVGEIVDIGAEVNGYAPGDRVTAEGHVTCGMCRNCRCGRRHLCEHAVGIGSGRNGAFAEYLAVPAANLWPLHSDIPSELAAIFDPFGNAVHSALSFDLIGEDVLITGAGPIGIMAAAVCRFAGARHVVVTDVNDYRLRLAATMGASRIVNVQRESVADEIRDLEMSAGFDVGLEMSGNPEAFNELLANLCHGARVGLLGFLPPSTEINWDEVIFKGLLLKGVYGREVFATWYKMSQMVKSGLDISAVITHRFAAEDYEQALEVVHSGECGKVILEWS